MGFNSEISWTRDTFNPFWGCTQVSPACDHCYANTFAHRMGFDLWGPAAPRRFFGDKHWSEPVKWNRLAEREGKRRQVFCGSMCDVMETHKDAAMNEQLNEARERLYQLIEQTEWLDWMLLTKRPQEYRKKLPRPWRSTPRPNVWLMTTVENEDYLWRADELLKAPAAVYGLSIEPLLGPIQLPGAFLKLGGRGWVIVGGESGQSARKMQSQWVRDLRDQCVDRGVPFHFKQWGTFGVGPDGGELVRLGVEKAGRMLDGREWDEVPYYLGILPS